LIKLITNIQQNTEWHGRITDWYTLCSMYVDDY